MAKPLLMPFIILIALSLPSAYALPEPPTETETCAGLAGEELEPLTARRAYLLGLPAMGRPLSFEYPDGQECVEVEVEERAGGSALVLWQVQGREGSFCSAQGLQAIRLDPAEGVLEVRFGDPDASLLACGGLAVKGRITAIFSPGSGPDVGDASTAPASQDGAERDCGLVGGSLGCFQPQTIPAVSATDVCPPTPTSTRACWEEYGGHSGLANCQTQPTEYYRHYTLRVDTPNLFGGMTWAYGDISNSCRNYEGYGSYSSLGAAFHVGYYDEAYDGRDYLLDFHWTDGDWDGRPYCNAYLDVRENWESVHKEDFGCPGTPPYVLGLLP